MEVDASIRTHNTGLYDPRYEHDACGVGFVVDMKGRRSHAIVAQALTILKNLAHRGACGCEENTGDGAGILIQMPHAFLKRATATLGFTLPDPGRYGAGFTARHGCGQPNALTIVREEGQTLLGWRDVPTDDASLGPTARAAEPSFKQIFIGRGENVADGAGFERKLFVIRKRVEHAIGKSTFDERGMFYIPSLSARTIVYKGMLTPSQVEAMFPDLRDATLESGLALVHSRFSTNTFPSWPLAHPYRYIAHNGEINAATSLDARARGAMPIAAVRRGSEKNLPIVVEGGSDSAVFDNVLNFCGRCPHLVMMIPEAWSGHETMDEDKAFTALRLPDGTLGQPGLDRLHRRHRDRRGARSQQPAPVATI